MGEWVSKVEGVIQVGSGGDSRLEVIFWEVEMEF